MIGELLQYKSGKYVRIIDFSGDLNTRGEYVKEISKNKIIICGWDCYFTIGTASFDYTYTKKMGNG
jgi:hypothetical protein